MIKLEHTVLPSPEQMQFVIEGMRNPMNSWDKSDSVNCDIDCAICTYDSSDNCKKASWLISDFGLGSNDYSLMKKLSQAGTDHRKFMRMLPVYVRITAPLYWWKEADTYKIGTVANSCSTMHKIQEKEFTLDDFSCEHLLGREDEPFMVSVSSDGTKLSPLGLMADVIKMLNGCREKYIETKNKDYWWQMIQLLPSSYNQTRNVMLNYEVLANIYKSRKNHKLDEWRQFCSWIKTLHYSDLIIMED